MSSDKIYRELQDYRWLNCNHNDERIKYPEGTICVFCAVAFIEQDRNSRQNNLLAAFKKYQHENETPEETVERVMKVLKS